MRAEFLHPAAAPSKDPEGELRSHWSSKCGLRSSSKRSWGNLLEMHMLRPAPGLVDRALQGMGPGNLCAFFF